MKQHADRFLTAIFCDDIRREEGNKLSFMGCYQSELFVPAMPTVLSKFCVYASVFTPKNKPFKALTLRVLQDDDKELGRIEVPAEGLVEVARIQDESATRKSVSTAIVFSPFVIEKPKMLHLMATTEDGEIAGPRLMIKLLPGQENKAPASPGEAKPLKQAAGKRKPSATRTTRKT